MVVPDSSLVSLVAGRGRRKSYHPHLGRVMSAVEASHCETETMAKTTDNHIALRAYIGYIPVTDITFESSAVNGFSRRRNNCLPSWFNMAFAYSRGTRGKGITTLVWNTSHRGLST